MRDIMIMKEFARFRIGEIEDKVFKPQDEFDIILEAYDIKGKGLHVKVKCSLFCYICLHKINYL